ncbi:hypothetical protein ACFFQF_30910 [Haladaptatus pallidirubidus]|uniref:hypothetical protein n=1 Tax=Haladaptatus pallidirubidus TaxID=1008152 RepID=UPI0035F0A41F
MSVEAVVPADPENGINSYEGTATIADSDFYHRYSDSSCGGPITASAPCEQININNVRISYNSEKYHDAIYTLNGRMNNGDDANLKYFKIENTEVHNDHDYQYAVSIGQEPNEWGNVSGVLGGSGPQTDSSYIQNQMTTNGDPTSPDTRPPLPSAPSLGEVPQQSAQLVRIDNTGNSSPSSYQITAGTYVLPAGDDGATVAMDWGPDNSPVRPPDSEQAAGSVPAGEVYAFYVTGGIVSTSASGPATWSVDGTPYSPGNVLSTNTLSSDQTSRDQWHQVEASDHSTGVVVGKPLSYNGAQPAHSRIRNDITSGFDYKIEEWDYLDGAHTTETFNTLAVPPAEYTLQLDDTVPYQVKSGTTSANHEFETVSLDGFFESIQPVILTQSGSFNGRDPIVTRVRDVSSDSFDVKVQEEGNGTHRIESIGYIALQPGVGYLDGKLFEVQRTPQEVTSEWTRIDFQQQYKRPQFIADLQTFHGLDTATLRYRNLTSTSVEVKVEEEQSEDSETEHATEAVGYAVFGEPTILTDTISSSQPDSDYWHQVDLGVQSPRVIIAKPLSYNGGHPAHVRLRNVTDGGFEYKLEEWQYLDGWHGDEIFHMMAVEPSEQELLLDDGSSCRIKSGNTTITDEFSKVSLESFFGAERPVVLAQVQTFNGSHPIVTRVANVSNDSFTAKMQEEKYNQQHTKETLGYVAIEQTSGRINGAPFEIQRTEQIITHQWTHISFQEEYKSPKFISDIQTFNGGDTCNIRYKNLSSTGVYIKIEEGENTDRETRHKNAESIGYAVFDSSM